MTITIETARLTAALTALKCVIDTRSYIPVLDHVMFDGAGRVSATDLDMTLSVDVGAGDHPPFIAGAETLQKALKGAGKGSMAAIEPTPDGVRVDCDGMTTTAPAEPMADYPRLTAPAGESATFGFEASEFAAILGYVAPCMSTEQTRYYMNGVCFKECSGALDVVATDGHRLVRYRTGLRAAALAEVAPSGVIVPHKAVKIARAMLAKATGPVTLTIRGLRIRIEAEGWTLDTKLIDGTFPNYTRAIPAPTNDGATFGRAVFLKAVERVSSVSGERSKAVKLTAEGDTLTIESNAPGGRNATMAVPCDVTGDGMVAGFNADYLVTLAKVVPGDRITITQSNSGDPSRITSPADDRLMFVLMPMRV